MRFPTGITLTDAGGRTIAPAVPSTGCGQSPDVDRALDAMAWTPAPTTPEPTRS
jgi:hypothetical protein